MRPVSRSDHLIAGSSPGRDPDDLSDTSSPRGRPLPARTAALSSGLAPNAASVSDTEHAITASAHAADPNVNTCSGAVQPRKRSAGARRAFEERLRPGTSEADVRNLVDEGSGALSSIYGNATGCWP